MLVLTRRAGQALRVGDDVEVHVVRIEGDRVVLGVIAPREVHVVRAELLGEVTDEVRRASAERSRVRDLIGRSG
jgi:carbon storage regulator